MAGNKALNMKPFGIIMALVFLTGSFISCAFSLLRSEVILQSRGQILAYSGNDIYAASGSASDIQIAVDFISSSGGTVHVPAGTFYWTGETVDIPSGVNVIGASFAGCKGHEDNWEDYEATTVIYETVHTKHSLFVISGQTNGHKPTRISGIKFSAVAPTDSNEENNVGVSAVSIGQVYNYRVDHCTFINFCGTAVTVSCNAGDTGDTSAYGVIDHCVVDNPYKLDSGSWWWGYGFYAFGSCIPNWGGSWDSWDTNVANIFGQYGYKSGVAQIYIEDCHFSRCRHANDAIQGGFYVARYNLYDHNYPLNWGMIGDHGATFPSARGFEAYNNTFIGNVGYSQNQAIWMRGGSALIYNNKFTNDRSSPSNVLVLLTDNDNGNGEEYQYVHDTYIWSNTITNATLVSEDGVTLNSDYYLRAPNQEQDGFTYTPYTYPHPLTFPDS